MPIKGESDDTGSFYRNSLYTCSQRVFATKRNETNGNKSENSELKVSRLLH